eukprot:UN05671
MNDLEEQQEGVPNDLPHELWRTVKTNKTTIAVYAVSIAISTGVILTQRKLITNMNHEKQEMSDNIKHLEHQMQKHEAIQQSMNDNLEKMQESIQSRNSTNDHDSNAVNGFWGGVAGTTVALATRVVIGVVFGV